MFKTKVLKSFLTIGTLMAPISLIILTSCNENHYKYPNHCLVCMGDSITYGLLPGGSQMVLPYPKALQQKLGFGKSYNYGISGSTISNGTGSYQPMSDRIDKMVKDADIIIFWGGVNDFRYNCDLGQQGDSNPNTIYGALDSISNYITTIYSNKFVMFITPLPTTISAKTYKLTSICDAISYTCNKYSIPLLDLYKNSGFEQEMTKSYSDGLHPTQSFVLNSVVPKIYDFIKNNI